MVSTVLYLFSAVAEIDANYHLLGRGKSSG
jgi:hypothetical protein